MVRLVVGLVEVQMGREVVRIIREAEVEGEAVGSMEQLGVQLIVLAVGAKGERGIGRRRRRRGGSSKLRLLQLLVGLE